MTKRINNFKWSGYSNLPGSKHYKKPKYYLEVLSTDDDYIQDIYFVNNTDEVLSFVITEIFDIDDEYKLVILGDIPSKVKDDSIFKDIQPRQGVKISSQDTYYHSDLLGQINISVFESPNIIWRFRIVTKGLFKTTVFLWENDEIPKAMITGSNKLILNDKPVDMDRINQLSSKECPHINFRKRWDMNNCQIKLFIDINTLVDQSRNHKTNGEPHEEIQVETKILQSINILREKIDTYFIANDSDISMITKWLSNNFKDLGESFCNKLELTVLSKHDFVLMLESDLLDDDVYKYYYFTNTEESLNINSDKVDYYKTDHFKNIETEVLHDEVSQGKRVFPSLNKYIADEIKSTDHGSYTTEETMIAYHLATYYTEEWEVANELYRANIGDTDVSSLDEEFIKSYFNKIINERRG